MKSPENTMTKIELSPSLFTLAAYTETITHNVNINFYLRDWLCRHAYSAGARIHFDCE